MPSPKLVPLLLTDVEREALGHWPACGRRPRRWRSARGSCWPARITGASPLTAVAARPRLSALVRQPPLGV